MTFGISAQIGSSVKMIQRKIQFDASVRNKFQRCFLLQSLAKMLTKFADIPSVYGT